ncbi:hypothetical protein HUB98_15825 [Paenibacillus barcinonensis]|uniref:Uncharacterized protein n=1 Tax=Paenibacillus barcinonensis TaxID=198119 RepID=A0ABX6Q6F4_PAEBA|nr:hypothetical protein [Paenibacillus barcinonensis]QKS57627.1 hypothetical protein HUB98_15825 [Paenibacillus barcinonensis]
MTTWRRDQPLSAKEWQQEKRSKPRHVCIAESHGLRLTFGAGPGKGRVPEPDAGPVVVVVSTEYGSGILKRVKRDRPWLPPSLSTARDK